MQFMLGERHVGLDNVPIIRTAVRAVPTGVRLAGNPPMLQLLAAAIEVAVDDLGEDEWQIRTGGTPRLALAFARLRDGILVRRTMRCCGGALPATGGWAAPVRRSRGIAGRTAEPEMVGPAGGAGAVVVSGRCSVRSQETLCGHSAGGNGVCRVTEQQGSRSGVAGGI